MPERRILVVDDEPSILNYVRLGLEHVGYAVVAAGDGAEALRVVQEASPHLVVLDLMLPDLDGLEVCRRIRAASEVPILLLTARGEPDDVVRGLDNGADGYLAKPFKLEELLARVHALLRLVGDIRPEVLEWGDLVLDLGARQLVRDGTRVDLTGREFALLRALMERPRAIHERDRLLAAMGSEDERDVKSLKACISLLRTKIGDSRRTVIRSVRGVGYTLGG
jgi:two-component system response regulator MprA